MADDIRGLSDELARDPSSLAFLALGDVLRRQGQLDVALKVALRGLERHPHRADAHDLLARIAVDRGEWERAFDEWDMVRRLDPSHAGALRGMGFVLFQQQRLPEAEQFLAAAAEADPDDASTLSALAFVREQQRGPGVSTAAVASEAATTAPLLGGDAARDSLLGSSAAARLVAARAPVGDSVTPAAAGSNDAREIFAEIVGAGQHAVLLLDESGLVLAGQYVTASGTDVGQEIGAELSGVSDEANRAMRHLDLGAWTSIVFETGAAVVALAPSSRDGLLVVAADAATPLGFVRRLLARSAERAARWIKEQE